MIRTIILLAASLIFILSFAVHSATIDSDYYLVDTGNRSEQVSPTIVVGSNATWQDSIDGAITWSNITVSGAPAGSMMTVTSNGVVWWHHPLLGDSDAQNFNCIERQIGLAEVIEHCTKSREHSIVLDEGGGTLRGLVSVELPTGGVLSTRQLSAADAGEFAEQLIDDETRQVGWTIIVTGPDGEQLDPAGIEVTHEFTTHEVTSIEPFRVEPFTELVWSVAALVGCFAMVLLVPVSVFFAAQAKEKRDEAVRIEQDDPET